MAAPSSHRNEGPTAAQAAASTEQRLLPARRNLEGTYQMQNLIVGKAVTGFSAFV
jgi:hypothetical protein